MKNNKVKTKERMFEDFLLLPTTKKLFSGEKSENKNYLIWEKIGNLERYYFLLDNKPYFSIEENRFINNYFGSIFINKKGITYHATYGVDYSKNLMYPFWYNLFSPYFDKYLLNMGISQSKTEKIKPAFKI